MEKLFSYGTLQLKNVQLETFGRLLKGKKDILFGYVKLKIKIMDQSVIKRSGTDCHPIIRFTGNNSDQVEGTIFEVSYDELKQADDYEVNSYIRTEASFRSGTTAWIYAAAD